MRMPWHYVTFCGRSRILTLVLIKRSSMMISPPKRKGGLGFAMRETDDGKIIANFILEGGPAAKAGMKWGAEIISLDGKPTAEVVDANVPWSSPFSNPIIKRLQQLRYATRFPHG